VPGPSERAILPNAKGAESTLALKTLVKVPGT